MSDPHIARFATILAGRNAHGRPLYRLVTRGIADQADQDGDAETFHRFDFLVARLAERLDADASGLNLPTPTAEEDTP